MNFSTNDTLTLAHILRDVAKAEIMPRWRSLSEGQIRQKSSAFDLVTDADEAAERAIAAKLAEVFPGAATIGEESCEKNPALLDTIGDHDLAFIVDPVDGTANFAAGLPLFGVICAVVCKGVVAAGVIFDPLGDDWAIAVKGQGAWYESLAGKRRPCAWRNRRPSTRCSARSRNLMPEPICARGLVATSRALRRPSVIVAPRMNIVCLRRAICISRSRINSCRGIMRPVGSFIAKRAAIPRALMARIIHRFIAMVAFFAHLIAQAGKRFMTRSSRKKPSNNAARLSHCDGFSRVRRRARCGALW